MPELVSVVIPAYEAGAFIGETIESVRTQEWRPLEVVVVDDCSPDDTAATVAGLAARLSSQDFAVRLLRRSSNGGVAEALKSGFSAATGDYVCWLSADDLFVGAERISRQVDQMRQGAGLVYATSYLQGEDLRSAVRVESHWAHRFPDLVDGWFERSGDWRVLGLMFDNPINGSTVMMRRGLMDEYGGFDRFDEAGQNLDSDGDLWLRLSALGVEFRAITAPAAFYRVHAGQASQSRTAEWRLDCEIVRIRVLLALDDLHSGTKLLNGSWPALLLALRGRYRTFPQVTRALCEMGQRPGVGPIPRFLVGRLRARLEQESLWDDEEYRRVSGLARRAMDSSEFTTFATRLATAKRKER